MRKEQEVNKDELFIPRTDFYLVWNNPEEKPTYKDKERVAETFAFPNFYSRYW